MNGLSGDAASVAHEDQLIAELRDLQSLTDRGMSATITGDQSSAQEIAVRVFLQVDALDPKTVRELLIRLCVDRAAEKAARIRNG